MIRKNITSAWIGVRKQLSEGIFVTVFNETLADVGCANWAQNRTDNFENKEPYSKNCVGIVIPSGGMDENSCEEQISYICKMCTMRDGPTKDCMPVDIFLNEEIGVVYYYLFEQLNFKPNDICEGLSHQTPHKYFLFLT